MLGTRLALVAALLLTVFLTSGCATSTYVPAPTSTEELDDIKGRLVEIADRERTLELILDELRTRLDDLGEVVRHCPLTTTRISRSINALRGEAAALVPALDRIESQLIAFHTKHPEHPEQPGLKAQTDWTKERIRALLAGDTLPPVITPEPAVNCPGTSMWNGRGCTTIPPTWALGYVYVGGDVSRPGAVKYNRGMTLIQAIAQAGGPFATASARDVELIRGGTTMRFELPRLVYPMLINPELRRGDVICIQQRSS